MEKLPLTYPQKFIQFVMTHLGPTARALHIVKCVRISGQIDTGDFERAATVLAARHPVLCARLDLSGDELMQRQGPPSTSFEITDIVGDTDHDLDVALSALSNRPFDLFQGNPFRITMARAHPDEAYLLLQGHHMFVDAVSMEALLDEYLNIFRNANQNVLDAYSNKVDTSFFSWARQENSMISDGTFARRAQSWPGKLHDADPVLHFRERGTEPAHQSIESIPFQLDPDQFQKFTSRARQLRVSPFALAAAAVFRALYEVTAQDNMVISVVSAARAPRFARTIGQFAGILLIKLYAHDIKIPEQAARLIFKEVMSAITNYVPVEYFAADVNWLSERGARGFGMTDAFIDYIPIAADLSKRHPLGDYEISPFPITARRQPPYIPYHGVATGFLINSKKDSIDGRIDYEPALFSAQFVREIAAALQDALIGEN